MLLMFLFIFVFLEGLIGIGYFFPGTLVLILFSAKFGLNYFFKIFIIAITANISAASLNYFLGYKSGKSVFERGFLFLSPQHFQKGKEFTNKYKGYFLLVGKLIPGIKEIITFLAGVFHIPFGKFLFWNVIGALVWFLIYYSLGYIFGLSFANFLKELGNINKIIILISLLLFLLFLFYSLFRKILFKKYKQGKNK